jgi:dTDP-glucose 4,6-dehydratase
MRSPAEDPFVTWSMDSHDKATTIRDVRVLVTGGCGFIGSHFVRRLVSAGDEVVVLDKLTYSGRQENLDGVDCRLHVGDIADAGAVARAADGCEAIVNFAAETHVDRSILGATDFGRTEFFGTQVLLEEVRRTGARYVQVSTDEVYGDLAEGGSASESHPVEPSSPYSVAKAAGDLHIPAYVRTFGVNASITRGSNTYGPNQYPEKLVPLFVTNALDGQPLPVYGDGKQIRDWLHVEDHCAGIEFVLREGAPGEVYNVGGGNERENIEITQRIVELTGADASLIRHVTDRPGHDRRYSLDSSKLERLGWKPERVFEEGLAETVEWYRANRSWWEPIKSGEYLEYYRRQYAERLA